MSTSDAQAIAVGERYWVFLLARAVPAALVAVFITFSANHSVAIGWMSLIVFGGVSGHFLAVGAVRSLRGLPMVTQVWQALVMILVALFAVVAVALLQLSSVVVLAVTMAALFVVSGALELVAGLRSRGLTPVSRDWIFLGATSIAFGLAVLLIPADLSQAITVPGKEVPNLTASVVVVGMLGAYAAIVAVYLVIAGLSLKWARHPDHVASLGEAS